MTGTHTHAGGIVHRHVDNRILLVRAKPEPHDWVIPKGHIEADEMPEQTAVREVREEAGVIATVVAHVGDLEYTKPNGKRALVACFLMRFVQETRPDEDRESRWCTFEEAADLVLFDNTRAIIDAARRFVASA